MHSERGQRFAFLRFFAAAATTTTALIMGGLQRIVSFAVLYCISMLCSSTSNEVEPQFP